MEAMSFRPGQRWREMVDDHGLRPAFGLCAFARVIDNEGINVWHRPQGSFRQAFFGQSNRLSGKPFEISVLAHMHNGMCAKLVPQPEVESEIVVWRNKIRRMVGVNGINVVAPGRLDRDCNIAEHMGGNGKPAAGECRIVLRVAPAVLNCGSNPTGEPLPCLQIVGQLKLIAASCFPGRKRAVRGSCKN